MSNKTYRYIALSKDGSKIAACEQAEDRVDLERKLRTREYFLISIESEGDTETTKNKAFDVVSLIGQKRKGTTPPDAILMFFKEVAGLTKAGLPLDRTIALIANGMQEGYFKGIVEDLLKHLKTGKSLSSALKIHGAIFEDFSIALIQSGEMTGKLAESVQALVKLLEEKRNFKSSLVSALIYPAILAGVSILSVLGLLIYVVPQFAEIFSDLGDKLPQLTKIILVISNALVEFWLEGFVFTAFSVFGLMSLRNSEKGKKYFDRVQMSIPLYGDVLNDGQRLIFARVCGLLMASGVALIPSIRLAMGSLTAIPLRIKLNNLEFEIKQGTRLSVAIKKMQFFDSFALQLIVLGEETGRLDQMLIEISNRYEVSVQERTKKILALVEPLIIVFLGIFVAVIIMAILLGILSVNEMVV